VVDAVAALSPPPPEWPGSILRGWHSATTLFTSLLKRDVKFRAQQALNQCLVSTGRRLMSAQRKYLIAIVGIGAQGARIVDHVCDLGHELVAAVDVGEKVGTSLRSFTTSARVPDVTVSGSVTELVGTVTPKPDIVILAAAMDATSQLELVGEVLDRGVNVITLHPDLFSRDGSWADALHKRAVAGGSSFLATGVQDTWWVQIPSLVASSSVGIHTIRITSTLSLAQLSGSIGEEMGVGASAEDFAPYGEALMQIPATLGAPLREAARRMGAVPGEAARAVEPVVTEADYVWEAGERTIPASRVVGLRETFAFDTDLGIRFEGVIEVLPISEDETADELHVLGTPQHHLRYAPFPGFEITNVALVSRIPDVIDAPPGVLFSAELPPAGYQVPGASGR
jgi:2,4-diaminopentanoate dehydrogenase